MQDKKSCPDLTLLEHVPHPLGRGGRGACAAWRPGSRARREPRGPAARGWCKTPYAGGPGRPPRPPEGLPGPCPGGSWGPGAPGVPGSPGSGVPDPRPGGRGSLPGGPLDPGRSRTGSGDPGEGGFTSTPRAGAPRFPGAVPGPGAPGGPEKGLREAWNPAPPGRGPETPPRGTAGPRREGLM